MTKQQAYIPQYQVGNAWYAFQERGQDVVKNSEAEAQAYLRGVAGKTRIEYVGTAPAPTYGTCGHLSKNENDACPACRSRW